MNEWSGRVVSCACDVLTLGLGLGGKNRCGSKIFLCQSRESSLKCS